MRTHHAILIFLGLLLIAWELDDLGEALGNVKVNQTTTWSIRTSDSAASTKASAKALNSLACALGYCPPTQDTP